MTNQIYTGDCFEKLPALDENSVHAIVTDPPYGLAFMGRSWDDFEPKEYQAWCEKWATECLRVLKPGGHLLAFSGNRTHHRLMSGIEDAGYEIRDTITWHYGSGFPKALDVSKAIDKQADADREVIGYTEDTFSGDHERHAQDKGEYPDRPITPEPATEQAEQWDGFKSALKPATEFVCVARSPLAEDTIAENVVAHGTGALNIDATRIDHNGDDLSGGGADAWDKMSEGYQRPYMKDDEKMEQVQKEVEQKVRKAEQEGRYPSNVVFDARQADVLDDEVGETEPRKDPGHRESGFFGNADKQENGEWVEGDSGGPSRYFYTSKASKAERTLDGKIDNAHPTVKPIDLMEWLVSLATAKEQIVLDPFAGSGTTCKAAKNKTRQFIGIEQQEKWADVARVRSGLPPDDHSHIRADDEQHGLEQF
ncbi:hypothetical protein OSG_eHPE5_00010 [environmental Halophage eHP-E5]|nr:hypothetical protein OSG_eHPE5_00010 [environmental Halophage eHP-E5]